MIAAHQFFSTLAPAAVFNVLRYFGSALNGGAGNVGLARLQATGSRFEVIPPVEIGRLLLHFAWESQGRQNVTIIKYLSFNRRNLMLVPHELAPDFVGWDIAANQILGTIREEVNIFYQNEQWRVVCANPKYRLVPEIDLLLQKFDSRPTIQISNSQNVVVNSEINAGHGVHIGNKERTYLRTNFLPTPAMVIQAAQFSAQMHHYLQENRVEEAITAGLNYTQLLYPEAHEDITSIRLSLQSLGHQHRDGSISIDVAQVKWGQLKDDLAGIVTALTTWK